MGEFFTGVLATIGALFVIGPIFWLISAVLFGWLIFLTEENDGHFMAVVSVGLFVWLATRANGIGFEPLLWLKWFGIYLAVGSAWSFVKWFSFLHKTKDRLKKLKQTYLLKYNEESRREILVDGYADGSGKFRPEAFPAFAEFLTNQRYLEGRHYNSIDIEKPSDVIPNVSDNFAKLTSWIVWWPTSAFWTILNDPIRRIARQIVKVFRELYSKMAAHVFSSEV